jgi:hypothetical protein
VTVQRVDTARKKRCGLERIGPDRYVFAQFVGDPV